MSLCAIRRHVTLIAMAGLARIELNSFDISVGSTLVSWERVIIVCCKIDNCTTYIFSMGVTVQTECNNQRYCMLLGVILHVAKADIALLIETMYIIRLTINSTVESAIRD